MKLGSSQVVVILGWRPNPRAFRIREPVVHARPKQNALRLSKILNKKTPSTEIPAGRGIMSSSEYKEVILMVSCKSRICCTER